METTVIVASSYYDAGFIRGQKHHDLIHTFLRVSTVLNEHIPFIERPEGRKIYEGFLSISEKVYPDYVQELKGIAAGAEVEFEKLFILVAISKELTTILRTGNYDQRKDDGCSTLFVNTLDRCFMGHTEDQSADIPTECGTLVDLTVDDHRIVAYCLPGGMFGHCFGFNSYGLAFSLNATYSKTVEKHKLPRNFLSRAVVDATSIDHALDLLRKGQGIGVAHGFTINMFDYKNPKKPMVSVEVHPAVGQCCNNIHVKEIGKPSGGDDANRYFHANSYIEMDVDEWTDKQGSSYWRIVAYQSYPPPSSSTDIREILGSETNERYPIYRSRRPTDPTQTLATVLFEVSQSGEGSMSVYRDHPVRSVVPDLVIPLK